MLKELRWATTKSGLQLLAIATVIVGGIYYFFRKQIWLAIYLRGFDHIEKKDEFFFFTGIGVLLILFVVYSFIKIVSGRSIKDIKNYPKKHPEYTIADLEADYMSADKFGKEWKLGDKWFFFIRGTSAELLDLSDIIWTYYSERTNKGSTSRYLRVYTKDKKNFELLCNKEDYIRGILQEIKERNLPIVVGYDQELKTMYRKDFARFMRIANGTE